MIFEHPFSDNFCNNFLSHTHIIFYFISLLLWFPCQYHFFLYKIWLSNKLSPNWLFKSQQLIADSGAQRPTPKMLQRDCAQRYDRYFIKTKTTKIRKQREQNRVLYEQNRGLFVQTTNRSRESRMEFGINNNKENQNKKVTGQQSFEIVKQKNNRITEQTR